MKQVCVQCYMSPIVERVYSEAERVVASTNEKVQAASDVMTSLRKAGTLSEFCRSHPLRDLIEIA